MTVDIATSTIVLQAFRLIELDPPVSFGEGSPQALAAAEQYATARDAVLESYDWASARVVAELAAVSVSGLAADPGLPYTYALPSGALVLRRVYGVYAWRQDGRVIRSAQASGLTVRYTAQIEREADLPATLRLAVSYQLAHLLAPFFVGSRTKREDIASGLERALAVARLNDAHSASGHLLDGAALDVAWTDEALR